MPRYTKQDIGRVLPPVNVLSWIKPTELPEGHEEPCPMCGVVDDRDPSKNRLGTGTIRHDFINQLPKTVNGYIFKPGVSLVEYLCEVCNGTGSVWVNEETGIKEPSERPEPTPTIYKRLAETKHEQPDTNPLGMVIGTCRGCHQITSINTDCYCDRC